MTKWQLRKQKSPAVYAMRAFMFDDPIARSEAESTFGADTKRALAGEIARIHSSMVHVPSSYVNVAFHELEADDLYAGESYDARRTVAGWDSPGFDDTAWAAEPPGSC